MVDADAIEDLFASLGNPGRYHILIFFLTNVCNFWCIVNYVIVSNMIAITPNHRCDVSSWYLKEFHQTNPNITFEDLQFNSCFVSLKNTSIGRQIACQKWAYDAVDGRYVESLVTKWDLVCDKKYYIMLSTTIFFVGVLIGALSLSHLADRFGRRRVILCSGFSTMIILTCSIWSTDIYMYTALRFVGGIVLNSIHSSLHVLGLEMAPKHLNVFLSFLFITTFIGTLAVGSLIGWLVMVWWKIQLYLSIVPLVSLVIAYFYLPESFKWLVVHRKKDELLYYVQQAAKFNGVLVPDIKPITEQMDPKENEVREKAGNHDNLLDKKDGSPEMRRVSFCEMMRNGELRKRLFLGCCLSLTATLSFYISAMNVGRLSSHPYKVMLMSASLDIIPLIFTYHFSLKFGKRRIALVGLAITAIFSICYRIYNHIALVVIGKMFVGLAAGMVFTINVDIYPTVVRNTCNGLSIAFGRFGGILGPQVVLLGVYTTPDNPVLVVGILTLMAAVCLYILPDMRKHNHPNTLQDLKEYRKNRKTAKTNKKNRDKESKELIEPELKPFEESDVV